MPRIEEMYAFVVEDANGDEGIIGVKLGDTFMPLVGADMARVDSMRELADEAVRLGGEGKPYRILRFSTREDIS